MDIFTDGFLPNEVKPSFIQTESQGILDYIDPFAHIGTPDVPAQAPIEIAMMPDRDPLAEQLAQFAGKKSSAGTRLAPVTFDWEKTQADRYVNADDYKRLGFDFMVDNESKYGRHQGTGEVLSNALAGAWKLGTTTYVDGWKGWGRMVDALWSWDASKLMGNTEELAELHAAQQEIMNKYAIFMTPEAHDTLLNRQFFGNMIQQGGFMMGTMAQFLTEELMTMGLSTGLSATKFGLSMARVANIAKKSERLKDAKMLGDGLWKSDKFVDGFYKGLKKFAPVVGTVDDIVKYKNAGASFGQLVARGVAGIKRDMAEVNMAFTEARMEAAGTYGDLNEKLIEDYTNRYGKAPDVAELERISRLSMDGAWDNFVVNSGVIAAMNRIQFDNLFSKFNPDRALFGRTTSKAAGKVLNVSGKIAGQQTKRAYQKGITGTFGTLGKVAKDFGKKQAAFEAGKSVGRNLLKWEAMEGIQELIQEGSNFAVQDYYSSLYNGSPAAFNESLGKAIEKQNPFTNLEATKTFLMGALTGRMMSPINFVGSKLMDKPWSKDAKKQKASIAESIELINAFYDNPSSALPEWIANTKIQNIAAANMAEALENRNRYHYENAKDGSFAKAIAAAKKLDMVDSILDTIKGYGEHFTDEQFSKAFEIEANQENRRNVKEYMGKISKEIKAFNDEWTRLQDKYGDRVMPHLFAEGNDRKQAQFAKRALDDSIEVLATLRHKAKSTVERANRLQTEAAAVPGIGNALASAYRVLTSESNTKSEIQMLKEEIKALQDTPKKDQNTRDLLKKKEKMLLALEAWHENNHYNTYEAPEDREERYGKALKNFHQYIQSHQDVNTLIPNDDLEDAYGNVWDFMRLNADSQEYVDAYNTVANPYSFAKFHSRMLKGSMMAASELKLKAISEVFATKEGFQEEHMMELLEILALGKNDELTPEERKTFLNKLNALAEKADKYDPEDYKRRKAEREAEEARKAAEAAAAADAAGSTGTKDEPGKDAGSGKQDNTASSDNTDIDNPGKPDPVLDEWIDRLEKVVDVPKELEAFRKEVHAAISSKQLSIEQGETLDKLINDRLENLKKNATFTGVEKGAILVLENKKIVKVTFKNDNEVKYTSYTTKSNTQTTLKKEDFNKTVKAVYNNEKDYQVKNPSSPVTPAEKTTAAQSQETNVDFINDKEARQKAIEEAQTKSAEDLASDFLDSIGCKP